MYWQGTRRGASPPSEPPPGRRARRRTATGWARASEASDPEVAPAMLERAVHLRLELPEQVDGRRVVERQELRQEDATDPLGAVDPEEGVGETGPGEAAGRTARRRWLGVDQEAQAPLLAHAGEQLDVVGQRRHRGLEHADLDRADVVLGHEGDRLGAEHLDALEAAILHDHPGEGQVIPGGAVEPTAAHQEFRVLREPELDRGERAALAPLMHGRQPRPL